MGDTIGKDSRWAFLALLGMVVILTYHSRPCIVVAAWLIVLRHAVYHLL